MSTIAGLSVGAAGPVSLETGMYKSSVRMPRCSPPECGSTVWLVWHVEESLRRVHPYVP